MLPVFGPVPDAATIATLKQRPDFIKNGKAIVAKATLNGITMYQLEDGTTPCEDAQGNPATWPDGK